MNATEISSIKQGSYVLVRTKDCLAYTGVFLGHGCLPMPEKKTQGLFVEIGTDKIVMWIALDNIKELITVK